MSVQIEESRSSHLPTFAEAMPLGETDTEFVGEFRELLARYGNTDRFGLCLLHEHFEVGPDEILMETNDPQQRTLSVTTEKLASVPNFKATMWRMNPVTALQGCAEDKCKVYEPLQGCAEGKCD